MPDSLSPRLARFLEARYDGDADAAAERLRAAHADGVADTQDPERVLAALAIVGEGTLEGVDAALALARTDWRDLLVSAGLAHEDWPAVLDRLLGARG